MFGPNAVYKPEVYEKMFLCFSGYDHRAQAFDISPTTQNKVVSDKSHESDAMSELTATQLTSVNKDWAKSDLENMEQFRLQRFLCLFAQAITFNAIDPQNKIVEGYFKQKAFHEKELEEIEDMPWQGHMYEVANKLFYKNLVALWKHYKKLQYKIPEELVNKSLAESWELVGPVLRYMSYGVFDDYGAQYDNKHTNKQQMLKDGCDSGPRSGGLMVNDFVFLYPLVAGAFAERDGKINAKEMMKGKSLLLARRIVDEIKLGKVYPINQNGVVVPKNKIDKQSKYHGRSAENTKKLKERENRAAMKAKDEAAKKNLGEKPTAKK